MFIFYGADSLFLVCKNIFHVITRGTYFIGPISHQQKQVNKVFLSMSRRVSAHWLSRRRVNCTQEEGRRGQQVKVLCIYQINHRLSREEEEMCGCQNPNRGLGPCEEKHNTDCDGGALRVKQRVKNHQNEAEALSMSPEKNDLRKPAEVIWSRVNVDFAKELQFHFHVRHFRCLYSNRQ